jgi:hypothetical protein
MVITIDTDENEAALGRGTGAAVQAPGGATTWPYSRPYPPNCQPPNDELRRYDYAAWENMRRRFLLAQAAAYTAGREAQDAI